MPPIKKVKKNIAKSADDESESVPVISGQLQKKLKKQKQKLDNQRGVVFLKHLPHGFFEEQLKKYFEQFGTVTRVRLARSKRTGGSKGFAFIEFEYPEVAQVAAETMDNYLMFKKLVKASYIPPNEQRFNYFKTSLKKVKNKAGKEIYISAKTAAIQRKVKEHNDWSENSYQKRIKKDLQKIQKLQKKYDHLGIDFSSIIIAPETVKVDADNKEEDTTAPDNNVSTDNVSSLRTETETKKELQLGDLLGSTIAEDSDDDDWSGDESPQSDEDFSESLSNSEGGTEQEEYDDSEDEDNKSADDIVPLKQKKKLKLSCEKSRKPFRVDRLDQIIKRKPHQGAIKKAGKNKVVKASKVKKSLQVAAVKELIKSKSSIKSNQNSKLNKESLVKNKNNK